MHGTLPRAKIQVAYLMVTDGLRVRCIGTNHYGDCGLTRTNQWGWIVGHMISEFGCEPEEVTSIETDEGDRIAVNGNIVGELVIE